MRAIWTGAISFGLVNIPVRLFSASESKGNLDFDMLHKDDLGQIRYARICKADGKEIPYEEIVKGYEYQKGDYVVLTEADFKKVDVKKTSTIEVIEFSESKEIDPVYYEKPYFLSPQKGAEKPYGLLLEALKKSKKVGVAKYVLRNREHLAVIAPKDNIIVLNQLRFDSELRKPDDIVPKKAEIAEKEVEMALALVEQLTAPFAPEKFKDTYTEELKEVIEEKAKGKPVRPQGVVPKPTEAQDILAALRKSLEQEREKVRR